MPQRLTHLMRIEGIEQTLLLVRDKTRAVQCSTRRGMTRDHELDPRIWTRVFESSTPVASPKPHQPRESADVTDGIV